jgi:3-dehydroquinate synthase
VGELHYPVVVARDARPELIRRLRELEPTLVQVVADIRLKKVATKLVGELARGRLPVGPAITFKASEKGTNLATVSRLYDSLDEAHLDRKGVLVAVGGGVTGDVVGFAAATWMRGVPIVHMPTTLLAMVDSAIGGKTGVDHAGQKNLIGAFHQPAGVFASLDLLATLPEREIRSGLGEVLKTAILSGEELFSRVEDSAAKLRRLDLAALEPVVRGCVELKRSIVARDPRETGERALLNLGHTLGHALEELEGFSGRLRHGEAVAVGVHFACRLAVRMGMLEAGVLERVLACASALGLPVTRRGFAPEKALSLMKKDKKARGGKLRLVLPRAIGRVEVVSDVDERVVSEELAAFATLLPPAS